jgi:HK97 family phage major capsid protein
MDRFKPRNGTLTASLLVASCAAIFASPVGPRIMLDAERGGGSGGQPDRLKALLERKSKLRADMRAIITTAETDGDEGRDLTPEERTTFDAMKAEVDAIEPRIERLEEQAGAEAVLDQSRGARAAAPQFGGHHRRGAEAKTEFENIGEFLSAVRFNPNDQRLKFVEGVGANGDGSDMSAEMRMDDGAAGGFALPVQFRATLMKLDPQGAIVRPRATVIEPGTPPDGPISMPALDQTGNAPANFFGGVQVNWIGEGGQKPLTDMKLREITLTPHEVAGLMVITDKLLRNWQASSGLIEQQLRGAIDQAEDFAFLNGNGVGKPLGFLSAKATYRQPRLAAGKIQYLDLVAMLSRSWGNDAVFVYSKSALPQLMTLQNPNGQYIWTPSAVPGQPNMLLGRGAVESNRNPQLGTYGDIWLADLKQYLIKDGSGPFVTTSEHVLFSQNKTVIKAFWNVDGSPWLTQPIQLENGFLSSPFVGLDVPSVD